MSNERRRRTVFAVLLALAIAGAAALMASVLVEDMTWRVALQLAGLATCSVASLAVVLTVRRWGAADDFWWIDSGSTPDTTDTTGPVERAGRRDAAYIPGRDTDR